MRVIGGFLGGRTFDSPSSHVTHPMSEKVRGALFNALGDIHGLTLLDAYGGSGAIALEAVSRGATRSLAIEKDKHSAQQITSNAAKLGISKQVKTIRANVVTWSQLNADERFDIIVCDPPYDHISADVLNQLAAHAKAAGVVVLSLPPQAFVELSADFELVQTKDYGDATLAFWRRIS